MAWQLENNFALADTRLNGLLRSIRGTPSLLKDYDEEITNLEAKDFIQKVPFGDWREFCVYLPHHPITREDKETTKIRPVFYGSAKGRNRLSLNDYLDLGPNLNPDLTGVLMRWRLKRVAWIADIEKAFLNIALPEEDAQAIRFLWTSDPADPKAPKIAYRWNRLPFGLTSSPFILRAAISKHLRTFKTKFPDLVTDIEAQLYVDYWAERTQWRKRKKPSSTLKVLSQKLNSRSQNVKRVVRITRNIRKRRINTTSRRDPREKSIGRKP